MTRPGNASRTLRRAAPVVDDPFEAFVAFDRPPDGPSGRDGSLGDGSLAGWTIGVKDVIDVAGLPTRCGSSLTRAEPATADAPVVARLRAAGATVIGKTHCTEWALNDPAPTRNPWRPGRTPGGSSAGSGVAVALGLCRATVDTQTAGDVLRPAAHTGAVGFKPTFGWSPTEGTQPVAPSIDTIGVMAAGVEDIATAAAALADAPDRFAEPGPPVRARLTVLAGEFFRSTTAAARANLAGVTQRLVAAGALVEEREAPVDLRLVHATHRVIVFAECAAEHGARYRRDRQRYGPKARELIDLGLVVPAHAYLSAQRDRRAATAALADLFAGADAVLTPLTPGPAPADDTTGDSTFQIPWTLCGFPTLTLPTGLAGGLPLGLQLVGPPGEDGRLLAVARWCEAALDVHLDPLAP